MTESQGARALPLYRRLAPNPELNLFLLLIACAPEIPDGTLRNVPWVEGVEGATCETLSECRSDEFCHQGSCLLHTARSFEIEFLQASVGGVKPNGAAWETSSFNNSVAPDLIAGVYWIDASVELEADDENYISPRCVSSEKVNVYDATWNERCSLTPEAIEVEYGLGPMGFEGEAIKIFLMDVDTFDFDSGGAWYWEDAAALDELAQYDGQTLRLEEAASADGGEPLWLDIDVKVEVNP